MRAKEPGQSLLLMLDVADVLISHQFSYAVIGAVAAAVHGSVRASLDADAIVAVPIPEAQRLCGEFEASGLKAQLRMGDMEDPVAALLAVSDSFENRVDLLMGLRGMVGAGPVFRGVAAGGGTGRLHCHEGLRRRAAGHFGCTLRNRRQTGIA